MNQYEERRRKLQKVFQDTMTYTERMVSLAAPTAEMVSDTKVYIPEIGIDPSAEKNREAKISVVEDTTFSCARKLAGYGRVAALNFANPVNPGGGVVGGAIAQEECLCRSSNLYAGLTSPQMMQLYYDRNQKYSGIYGSDTVGYHPGVTVFRDDDLYATMLDPQDWFQVDVITCAAPIVRSYQSISDAEQYKVHVKRGRKIIGSAVVNHADILVLGAFGCGAFGNNPGIVARAYRYLLVQEGYAGFFQRVVFAIKKDHNDVNGNFAHFSKVFG